MKCKFCDVTRPLKILQRRLIGNKIKLNLEVNKDLHSLPPPAFLVSGFVVVVVGLFVLAMPLCGVYTWNDHCWNLHISLYPAPSPIRQSVFLIKVSLTHPSRLNQGTCLFHSPRTSGNPIPWRVSCASPVLSWLTSCPLCWLHGIVCSRVCGLHQPGSSLWAGPDSSPLARSRLACPYCWGRQVTLEVQRWELAMVSQERAPGSPPGPFPEAACALHLGISRRQKGGSAAGTSIWLLPLLHFLSHELAVVGCSRRVGEI